MEYQAAETAHTEQGAVQNYSVFKDCKRPLVEYDVGIKITGHWSSQNIRVSSKNSSKNTYQELCMYQALC